MRDLVRRGRRSLLFALAPVLVVDGVVVVLLRLAVEGFAERIASAGVCVAVRLTPPASLRAFIIR